MNRRLQRSLSLAVLTLTLASASLPTISTLAATNSASNAQVAESSKPITSSSKPADTHQSQTAQSTSKRRQSQWAPLPDSLSDVGQLDKDGKLIIPQTGQPGARLSLDSLDNTRDLGGYVTADGKWKIKPGRLIRSANLHHVSDNDIQVLLKDGLTHIVDFRTPGQVKGGADKPIAGTTWENISILGKFADGGLNTDADGNYPDVPSKAHDGGFYNHQLEFSHSAITGYHRFLNELLTNSGATLFHCSSGKDRTGIAAVILMSIFGMSPKTIAYDYMMSDSYNHHVDYSWLKEYYHEINNYYHGMPNYVSQALEFSPYQQELLKSKYLVSNDGKDTPYPAPVAPVTTAPSTPATVTPAVKPTDKPKPQTDVVVPTQPVEKATQHKRARAKIKVVSVKKIKKAEFVHLKGHRAYFYDVHLKHKVGRLGKTGAHPKAKWRIVKTAKIKVNGKLKTFYQVKSPHGALRWIQKNFVKCKRHP